MNDLTELESTVLYGMTDDAAALCEMSEFTARALGFACLYRGLDMVSALVESGASFRYPEESELSGREMRFSYYRYDENKLMPDYSLMLFGRSDIGEGAFELIDGLEILPAPKRAEVLDYLCDEAKRTDLNLQKLLYFTIREGNEAFYNVLKEHDVFIRSSDRWIFKNACNFAYSMSTEQFLRVFGLIAQELDGEKIRGNMTFYNTYFEKVFSPESFEFILEHFDRKSMNQTRILKKLVDMGSVDGLIIAQREGWLKYTKKRDELIQYASENKKAECAAWLLDFKNRTADLEAERKKAEKEMRL